MELPIVAPAPVVTDHATVFRDLFDNQCQFRHFQHYLTGLLVLPTKSMASMARCLLDSADQTNLSRFLAAAPWREDAVNRRRIRCMLQQTKPHRRRRRESLIVIDDTLGEQVGSLFDDGDRHYNHSDGTSPLAHKPITSFSVSGPVRLPLGLRLYRRYEALTHWEACVAQHFPDLQIPTDTKGRNRLHKQVDPVLLQAREFRARHEQFRTNIALAIELVKEAIRHKVPFGVVEFDAWSLAEDLVRVLARRRKDWISLLKKNRLLETASLHVREANGGPLKLPVTGRSVVLVANRVDWTAAKIIGLYLHRGPTETFDQDSKGPLGFNEDRMRSTEAIGKHWCLVFVAYSLLHLTCLPAVPDRTKGLIHTMGDACRQQGRALLQKLLVFVHDQLSHGAKPDHVFAQLFAKQRDMVPA